MKTSSLSARNGELFIWFNKSSDELSEEDKFLYECWCIYEGSKDGNKNCIDIINDIGEISAEIIWKWKEEQKEQG